MQTMFASSHVPSPPVLFIPSPHFSLKGRSTPVSHQISSVCFMEEGKKQHLFVKVLEKLMETELEDAIHEKAHFLIESVFPDSKLPFNVNHTLLDKVADIFNNLQH